jgi:hypothetical protein
VIAFIVVGLLLIGALSWWLVRLFGTLSGSWTTRRSDGIDCDADLDTVDLRARLRHLVTTQRESPGAQAAPAEERYRRGRGTMAGEPEAVERPIGDGEAILLLYWREWVRGPVEMELTPEAAAGNCIALWGSAREALVARASLSDRWSRSVNDLLMEAAKDG